MQLIAENLAANRGDTRIFEGVSFALRSGEGMTITGPNGAGKSTLLRVLAGFLPPSEGFVEVSDGELAEHSHYLGPNNGMKPNLTVKENLLFWQDFCGGGGRSTLDALDEVGLGHVHDVPFSDLSTGQKRRVAIARLFVSPRYIWLLDEPTTGLDRASEHMFTRLIVRHLRTGGMVIAATHLSLGVDAMKNLRFAEAPL
ncbi:heme ABC exporter ATP-binding protein CcmA [Ahrensia kielensis]|uniref:Heme ABC exporter ATP-binding protein CcmA n=1 Tax=Ahrensia kielensis TaxID=76980 RepID=A0ABU9T7M4_9HYPH